MRETLELLEDLLSEKVVNVLGREIELPDGVTDREVIDHLLTIIPKSGVVGAPGERLASVFNPIKWAKSSGIGRITSFSTDGIGLNAIRIIKNKGLLDILKQPDGSTKPIPLPPKGTYNWSRFTGKGATGFRDLVVGNEQEGPVSTQSMSDPVGKGEIALSFLFGLDKAVGDTDLTSDQGEKGYSVKYMGVRGDDATNISEGSTKKVLNIAARILHPDDPNKRGEFLKIVTGKTEVSYEKINSYDPRAIEAINSALGSIELNLLVTFDGGFRLCDHLDAKLVVITKGRVKIRQREANETRSDVTLLPGAKQGYDEEIEKERKADEERKKPVDAGPQKKLKKKSQKKPKSPYEPTDIEDPQTFSSTPKNVSFLFRALGQTYVAGQTSPADIIQVVSGTLDKIADVKTGAAPASSIENLISPEPGDSSGARSSLSLLRNIETLRNYATDKVVTQDDFFNLKQNIFDEFSAAINAAPLTSYRSTGRYVPSPGMTRGGARMFNHLVDLSTDDITEPVIDKFIADNLEGGDTETFEGFKSAVKSLASQQEDMGLPVLTRASNELDGEFTTSLIDAKVKEKEFIDFKSTFDSGRPNKAARPKYAELESRYKTAISELQRIAKETLLLPNIESAGRHRAGPLVSETLTLLEDLLSP